jgi:hypothetical protein
MASRGIVRIDVMRRLAFCVLGLLLAALLLSPPVQAADQSTPRRTVSAYLHAISRGDARVICSLLAPRLKREVVHDESARSCRAAVRSIPRALGSVPIVSVRTHGATAIVVLGDAQYSDSGNDAVTLSRTHGRWYLTSM